jgi:hypothetical protein
MKIKEFIQNELLLPRLNSALALVVYDPDQRYRELCLELATDKRIVIDAGESSIESREAALATLRKLGEQHSPLEWMLVYVPAKRPLKDEQRQLDPFALYEACGAIFPDGDGDDYLNICLRAKPDYTTEIRRLFDDNPSPSFEMVDAIGAGASWPQLQATLKVESARDILMALLAPGEDQLKALKDQDGWAQEARDLLRVTLSLELKTRGKTWGAISEELWRFLLFSEFVFDLPVELPARLSSAPRAQTAARAQVDDLCDRLRSDLRTRAKYIEEAERVASELNLAEECSGIDDLGEKDTFNFEERAFLRRAINGLKEDDLDLTRQMLARHKKSVWMSKGESQAQWDLIRAALALNEVCDAGENQLPEHSRSQEALLDFYIGYLREVDSLQREFEQAVGDLHDPHGLMIELVGQARAAYRRLAEKVQTAFVKHLETSGWPPAGRLANTEVYDRFAGEWLKDRGRKIAYLMVDALRYELGVELEKLLAEDGVVELHAAYAQLPTITRVGMASLLPGAKSDLILDWVNDKLVPKLGDLPVGDVPQRMEALRKKLGDRFTEMTLSDFVRGKVKLPATAELLVLRSVEIDSQLESNPESTLGLIPGILKMIRAALHKLRGMGFSEAVIATDHGFFLNASAEAGDVCAKPQGRWIANAHDRLLLGEGDADSHSAVIAAERLGIRGVFSRCAVPRSLAPYRAGHLYFHGGASLAEAVVPVLVMRLESAVAEKQKFKVEMNYKHGAKKITTRLPVIEVIVYSEDLFAQELEILLEAQDAKGDAVGEPRPGGEVNAATGTVTLKANQEKPAQIVLRMHEGFRGKFTVKALNPKTLAAYNSMSLETDYLE